jgi:hypothetical protein
MKAVVLYCDRCAGEGKGEVRASLVVWIRTSLGGRPVRLDVCADHFAVIVGQASASANGAAPAPRGERVWSTRGGGGEGLERKAYERLVTFIAKHARFSVDDARAHLGKDAKPRAQRALRLLVADRKIERYTNGIYQRPGYSMPEPESVELAAAAVLKLIKAKPGTRVTIVAGLVGVETIKQWRATLDYLREHKLVRTKGIKSAMRLYAS